MTFPDIWAAPEIESVPTVFMRGERIVEVTFTEWRTWDGGGSWRLISGDRVQLPEGIDRIIYELPTGCYEKPLPLGLVGPGSVTFGFSGGPSAPLQPCRRSVHAVMAAAARENAITPENRGSAS